MEDRTQHFGEMSSSQQAKHDARESIPLAHGAQKTRCGHPFTGGTTNGKADERSSSSGSAHCGLHQQPILYDLMRSATATAPSVFIDPLSPRTMQVYHVHTMMPSLVAETTGQPIRNGASTHNSQQTSKTNAKTRRKEASRVALYNHNEKLRILADRMQLYVASLREQVIDLQLHLVTEKVRTCRQRCQERQESARVSTPVQLVHKYFKVFSCGYQSPAIKQSAFVCIKQHIGRKRPRNSGWTHESAKYPSSSPQARFIATSFANDFLFNAKYSLSAYLNQLAKYTSCHAGFRTHLRHIDQVSVEGTESVIRVKAAMVGYITQGTISLFFPRMLPSSDLALTLIGSFIQYPCHMQFVLNLSNQITQIFAEISLVEAFAALPVIGSLAQAVALLENTPLVDCYMVGCDKLHTEQSDAEQPARVVCV